MALVIDATGSVKGSDLSLAWKLGPDLVTNLPPGSQMAVITFKDRPQLLLDRTADALVLKFTIAGMPAGKGRAVLNDALYYAGDYLRRQPGRHKAIVMVGSGRDNGSVLDLERSLGQARSLGYPIFPVGVGAVDLQNLSHIAEETGGQEIGLHEAKGYQLAVVIEKTLRTREPATSGASGVRVEERRSSGSAAIDPWFAWAGGGLGLSVLALASRYVRFRRRVPAMPLATPDSGKRPGPEDKDKETRSG